MNFCKRSALLFLIVALATGSAFASGPTPEAKALIKTEMEKAKAIDSTQLSELLKKGDVVLLDVRQESEIPIMGRILPQDQQVEIPRGYIEIQTYSEIPDRDANIVVYCGKGIRSAFVVNTLQEMGYTNVSHLTGGTKAWKESGFKTY